MSPTRSNISKEEEALKLAIEQVNEDTGNYPGIKLRSLIRYADPDIDFDNIEQGKEKLCSNRRQYLDSRTRTRTSTRFDCPFLVKIVRKFITLTINISLC